MKRYISVFEMIARSSIYKVLLVISTMVFAEGFCFFLSMLSGSETNFSEYINQSQFPLIFKIAYVLVTIVIVLPGMNLGSTQSYTLQRLRIKENCIYWLQVLYNFFAYILLWGIQLVMIFVCAFIFQTYLPEGMAWNNQMLFFEFYRSAFMHSILPLEESIGWFMLLVVGVTTAMCTARFTKLQRQGKFAGELLVLVAAVLLTFPRYLGVDPTFIVVVMIGICIITAFGWAVRKFGGDWS